MCVLGEEGEICLPSFLLTLLLAWLLWKADFGIGWLLAKSSILAFSYQIRKYYKHSCLVSYSVHEPGTRAFLDPYSPLVSLKNVHFLDKLIDLISL